MLITEILNIVLLDWLARYYAGVHALGWRLNVLAGVSFGLANN